MFNAEFLACNTYNEHVLTSQNQVNPTLGFAFFLHSDVTVGYTTPDGVASSGLWFRR